MFGSAFFGSHVVNRDLDIVDMPPADWCVTTLQTLTNKYEHLTSVRKANPPFAEAVLNNFKSKLLNVVSSHSSLYDSDENSEGEAEWPLGGCASPYMDSGASEDNNNNTSNYLSMAPDAFVDSVSSSCYGDHAKSDDAEADLQSSSLSSVDVDAPASDAGVGEAVEDQSLEGSLDMGMLPPSIEEALRRILANSSSQVLSDTFTTFSTGDTSDNTAQDDEDDTDNDAQYVSDSGSCSPESLSSPEDPPEYLSANDSVDIFVNGFAANGSWDAMSGVSPTDSISLTPCKRKRNTEKEDQQAEVNATAAPSKTIPRNNTLQMSPRKRSRSTSRSDTAAVPKNAAAVIAPPAPVKTPTEQAPAAAA
ncbi:hypothetical protein H4R20_004260 [Coemansia guatemalensis]|uniref:Uncharacterized protein n=1 Tax=Coemansia guatemalensis TaxID=2761395 RepID=A0A9W8HXY6_9FUNG|nr:hypothetical protein H4R20_004260 [Coemansia guatemalensis]